MKTFIIFRFWVCSIAAIAFIVTGHSFAVSDDTDVVVQKVQPAGSVDTVFDILATIKRLFSNSMLPLFHEDGKVCFGVIKLDDSGEHLIIIDPTVLERLVLRVDDQSVRLRRFAIRSYGETWVGDKWIENDLVAKQHIGYVVKIPDNESFFLSCYVPKVGSHGDFTLSISRSKGGIWKSEATIQTHDNLTKEKVSDKRDGPRKRRQGND